MDTKQQNVASKLCSKCNKLKTNDEYYNKSKICRECFNLKRRDRYNNDKEYRQKKIQTSTKFKQDKAIIKNKLKEEEQIRIGLENKQCKYCNEIKNKDRFRYNRLKCKDCERDNPTEKFKRYVRTRIYNCLRNKNKTKHSIEYLGCSSNDYLSWMMNYNEEYNLENYGKKWHVDHIIPLSKFNLNNEQEQLIAFNWRNTMPLSAVENLSKNNKIIEEQIKTHYEILLDYHKKNNIVLPNEYINLFAKYLADGNLLKPSLPLTSGNTCEEHG